MSIAVEKEFPGLQLDIEKNGYSIEQCTKLLNFKTFSKEGKDWIFTILSKLSQDKDKSININNILKLCMNILENPIAIAYFQQSPKELFSILQKIFFFVSKNHLKNGHKSMNIIHEAEIKRIFYYLYAFIKSYKNKFTLLVPFIESDLFKTILKFSNTQYFLIVYNICQIIMFPMGLNALLKSYIIALVKGSDLTTMFKEKGEALRPIVTVMDILFKYSTSSSFNRYDLVKFLGNFIRYFQFSRPVETSKL